MQKHKNMKKVAIALAVGVVAVGAITASTVGAVFAGRDNKPKPVVPTHKHTYAEHVAVDATCETAGRAAYFSCDCGKYFDTDKKEIAQIEDLTIAATGHRYVLHASTATCETAGQVAYYTCENCDQYFDTDADKTKINAADIAEAPATGHTYVEHPATDAATCETAGHRAYLSCHCGKCFDLDKNEVELADFLIEPAKGHRFTAHAAIAARCETVGQEAYYTCKNCDKMLGADQKEVITSPKIIPATGHDYENHAAVHATCESTGRDGYYTCHACDKIFNESLAEITAADVAVYPATGHTYVEHATTATCMAGGQAAYASCQNCDKLFDTNHNVISSVANVPALGHKYVYVPKQYSSIKQNGYAGHYACKNGCGKVATDSNSTNQTTLNDLVITAGGLTNRWWHAYQGVVTLPDGTSKTITKEEYDALDFKGKVYEWYEVLQWPTSFVLRNDNTATHNVDCTYTMTGNTLTLIPNNDPSRTYVYTLRADGYLVFTNPPRADGIVLSVVYGHGSNDY